MFPAFTNSTGGGSGGGGGGTGGSTATVSFTPDGGSYSGTVKTVVITVGSPATKLRWKIDSGAYTTVNATTTSVNVTLSVSGHTLSADALSAVGAVLATHVATYDNQKG